MKRNKLLLIVGVLFSLLFSGCDKDEFRARYLRCTIDGVEYISTPSILNSMPDLSYSYKDNKGELSFFSDCVVPAESDHEAEKFHISFYLYMDEPLEVGKKYRVESIPGLDYYMPFETQSEYREREISYCHLLPPKYILENYCYGNGFVKFTNIEKDFKRNIIQYEGFFEFEIPFSREKEPNPPLIEVQGKFRCSNLFYEPSNTEIDEKENFNINKIYGLLQTRSCR